MDDKPNSKVKNMWWIGLFVLIVVFTGALSSLSMQLQSFLMMLRNNIQPIIVIGIIIALISSQKGGNK